MPYTNPLGIVYDSGDYPKSMDMALALADWDGFEERAREARQRGMRLGRGFANYVESSIGAPKERVDMTIHSGGRVDVVVGTQPTGQGHETSFAQVAADLLGVAPDVVHIIYGDTDIVRAGGGSHSGRSMRQAASVIYLAVEDLKADARARLAAQWGIAADAIDYTDGAFTGEQDNQRMDWFELAQASGSEPASESAARTRRTRRCSRTAVPRARSRSIRRRAIRA